MVIYIDNLPFSLSLLMSNYYYHYCSVGWTVTAVADWMLNNIRIFSDTTMAVVDKWKNHCSGLSTMMIVTRESSLMWISFSSDFYISVYTWWYKQEYKSSHNNRKKNSKHKWYETELDHYHLILFQVSKKKYY